MSRCLVFPILAIVISRAGAAPAPAEAAGRLEDFIHLTLVENHLRIDWLSNLQPPRQPLHLLGPEARWELRMPAPIRGVAPMTLQLQRPPSGTRDRQSYWYVHVSSSPDQLSILAHRGGRGAAAANTLRFGQSFDGSVHLVAIDNVTRKFAQASAADLVALRAQHPQLVRDWLVPLLRQLAGEDPLLPGAADAYRVFDEFSADPEIERRVRELLPRLADGDYQIREAASRRIAQLGPQAICAVLKMNLDELMPEQRWRLEHLLKRSSRRTIHDRSALRRDIGFLADCMEFGDDRVRQAARTQVEQLAGQPIPLHPTPTPAEWARAADIVRERIALRGK